jgi:hypothetical protein
LNITGVWDDPELSYLAKYWKIYTKRGEKWQEIEKET